MTLLQITFGIFAALAAVVCILGSCLKHHEACGNFRKGLREQRGRDHE